MLFPLSLQGKGTMDIEALPSYLYRLSYEHGYSVGEFMKALHNLACRENRFSNTQRVPHYILPGDLATPGITSKYIKSLLEIYTNQSLDESYLWILDKALGASRGEVSKNFRWCPECFHEMSQLCIPAYFKLIWFMKSVTACPIHRTPILEVCPSCNKTQNTYTRVKEMGLCQFCGHELRKRKTRLRRSSIRHSWDDIGVDVVKLFQHMNDIPAKHFPENGAVTSLNSLLDYYWDSNRESEFYSVMSRDEMLSLTHQQKEISFKTARKIAFRLGLPLYEFLAGKAKEVTMSLDPKLFCALPPGFLEVRKKVKNDHRLIIRKIKHYLKQQNSPPTIREVAEATGISIGYLEYRYPALVSQLVHRRREHVNLEKHRLQNVATNEALSFFVGAKYKASNLSKREAYRALRTSTQLPKRMIKVGIQKATRALGFP
ncbi:TniQ family protein [Aestuariibacter salexigens]|uniref:TniQ family protein n=1 Tax=Aestuariibacter salexigens TaxID=226010 RepID=UPI0003FC4BBA|nr:TniQ family protein [Aestuariibacter salexigens]